MTYGIVLEYLRVVNKKVKGKQTTSLVHLCITALSHSGFRAATINKIGKISEAQKL